VLQIVQHYARQMGLEKLAPHDMRRTCAKLCRKRGGDLEQIKFELLPQRTLARAPVACTSRMAAALKQSKVEWCQNPRSTKLRSWKLRNKKPRPQQQHNSNGILRRHQNMCFTSICPPMTSEFQSGRAEE
jgi:hypothetical protein